MIYIRYSHYPIGTIGKIPTAKRIYNAYLPDLTLVFTLIYIVLNSLALIHIYFMYYYKQTLIYIQFPFSLIMNTIQSSYQEYLDYLVKYRNRHDKK